jgi:hypothetical protein
MPVFTKCCGTCRRWDEVKERQRPTSLSRSRPGYGTCRLNLATYKSSDMSDCFGWKEADPQDLGKRIEAGLIEERALK